MTNGRHIIDKPKKALKVRRIVQHGVQQGSGIGFPTLNFNVGQLSTQFRQGVYNCRVRIDGTTHHGLMHFGPKLNHAANVFEVFVKNFDRQIYGQWVQIEVGRYIRAPKTFKSLKSLKKQLEIDLAKSSLYNKAQ